MVFDQHNRKRVCKFISSASRPTKAQPEEVLHLTLNELRGVSIDDRRIPNSALYPITLEIKISSRETCPNSTVLEGRTILDNTEYHVSIIMNQHDTDLDGIILIPQLPQL